MRSTLGSIIRSRREAAGLTQLALAYAAGVTPNTIRSLEHDRYDPRLGTLRALAGALGTTPAVLLDAADA